eukprot:m.1629732 g.1629732  ORF g.1629732 m.1629732 type:complete len:125 (+) comp25397_c0_seq34:75-449(+)
MDDNELAKLRASRMAEMQAQDIGQAQQQEERRQANEQAKNSMLSAVLDQEARTRLNSIAVVKPEKAAKVEGMIIQMVQRRQIQGKVSDQMLKGLLEQVGAAEKPKKTTITFSRRGMLDSDSDSD